MVKYIVLLLLLGCSGYQYCLGAGCICEENEKITTCQKREFIRDYMGEYR